MPRSNKPVSHSEIKSLIYCRVSSLKQVKEGHGLDTQEKRGRDHSKQLKLTVEKVFRDEGVSGKDFDRPGLNALINYIDENPDKTYVVIFDDLSRLARDVKVYADLRIALTLRKVQLSCPNFQFEDTPENELIGNVAMATAQYDRQKNRRQVIQKQRARLELGYWTFCQSKAFTFIKDPIHGKLLKPQDPYASIYKELIEKFEKGQIKTKLDARNFVYKEYLKHNIITGKPSDETIVKILTNPLFAGYIEYPKWDISLRKGHHKGFVSLESIQNCKSILEGKSRSSIRQDCTPDFALRGSVFCRECGKKLTASYSTGKYKTKYAYYRCTTKLCRWRDKSIKKETIDPAFEDKLTTTKLPKEYLKLVELVMQDMWTKEKKSFTEQNRALQNSKLDIEDQISKLSQRVVKTDSDTLIKIYEEEIKQLALKKDNLVNELPSKRFDDNTFGTSLKNVLEVLENPLVTWKKNIIDQQRAVLFMYFDNHLEYDKENGFGTPVFSRGYNTFTSVASQNSSLVEMEGIEPSS